MTKKSTGLQGANALFNNSGVKPSSEAQAETVPRPPAKPKPASPEKTKATFYLSDTIQERLDDAVHLSKKAVSTSLKRRINKSTLLEAALTVALTELEAQLAKQETPSLLRDIEAEP